jgi:hypothetical protein
LINNEKELLAHISDQEVQLTGMTAHSLVEDMISDIHKLKKNLSDYSMEHNVLTLKKETIKKEYASYLELHNEKESDLHKLQQQLQDIKQSITQTLRQGSTNSLELSMQMDIIQSKKENHEQITRAFSEEELSIAKDIRDVVGNPRLFQFLNEEEIEEKLAKIEERINERKQSLTDLKLEFETRKMTLNQDFKKKKEEIQNEGKKSLKDFQTESKTRQDKEKKEVQDQLKRARELEHSFQLHEGELGQAAKKLEVREK